MAFCTKCGAQLEEAAKFCVKCGSPVEAQPAIPVIEQPEVPVMEQPEVPVMEQPEVPVMEQPEVPVMEQPEVPVMEQPEVPVMEQPEVPVMEQPEVPVMEQPEVPVMNQPEVLVMEQPVMQDMSQQMMNQPVMQDMNQQMMNQPMMQNMNQQAYGNQKQKPKKNGKLIAALIGIGVLVVGIIAAVLILIFAGGTDDVDLSKYVTVEFEGYDTLGTADAEIDLEELAVGILKAQGEDVKKYSSSSINLSLKSLLNSIEIEISQNENLSNGDVVEVKITYDKKLMEENDLNFLNTELTFTAENLEELIEIDPFEDVTVEFSGTQPSGYAYYDDDSDIDVVKYCYMTFDKSDGLSNGDVVTLSVSETDIQYALESGYIFTETSKEYTVEGLKYYLGSLDDMSDEHLKAMQEKAEEEIEYEYSWDASYGKIENLEHVGTYFLKSVDDGDSYNKAVLIYTAKLISVKNEFEATQIYIPVTVTGLLVDGEGELDKYIYASAGGNIKVEGKYYSFVGYLSGADMYQNLIKDIDDDYTFEVSKGMPDFENETESATEQESESQSGTEGETKLQDGEETTSENQSASEEQSENQSEAETTTKAE